jgi:hypothetical protein
VTACSKTRRPFGVACALLLTFAVGSARAATQTALQLVAPDACVSSADLLQQLNHEGAPPDVTAATLRLQPDAEGYVVTLSLTDAGVFLEDRQATRTCSAALAWGAFTWNNLFHRTPAIEPRQELGRKKSLRLGLGANTLFGLGESLRETDIFPGASASVSADFEPVRLTLLGSYLAPRSNPFPGASPTTQQRIGAELCALSGNTETTLRAGACAGFSMNFIQFHTSEPSSEGGSTARWWDVHAALLGNLRLGAELELQTRLGAAVSPEPVKLAGPHGAAPHTRYVLEPMLLLAYKFDLGSLFADPQQQAKQELLGNPGSLQ